jgi:O-antigen/teichoic acid export membrane protein
MLEKLKRFLFKNTSPKQTVAKNTFWLSVSNFGGRFLRAAVVIYGARMLGTAGWGVFSYAITLAGFMTLFMDPGINAILTRNTAKSSEADRRVIFATTSAIKLVLIVLGCALIIFIAPYFSTLPGAKMLLPIAACVLAFDTARDFFSALLRGQERMEWDAYIQILMNGAILAFGFAFLAIRSTPQSLMWGYALGSLVGTVTAAFIIRSYFKDIFSAFSLKLVAPFFQSAWPFAVTGALGLLLTNADILIVSWMRNASDVGVYSAAIRIIQVLYLVPVVFQFGTLPVLSRLAGKNPERFRAALENILSFVFLASIPLALGGAILGTQVITLVFGTSFAAGGLSFKILMITMLIDFPASILSNAIFAYDHQRSLIITSAIAGILNVGLDLLLIPPFGIVGSAVGTLIAQGASNWYLWHTMNKINPFSVLPRLGKVALAGIVMAGASAILMASGMNVLVNVLISAALYFLLLKAFREPMLGEIKNIFPTENGPAETAAA